MEPNFVPQTLTKTLRIFLIDGGDAPSRRLFYSEPLEHEASDQAALSASPPKGIRGWAEARLHKLQSGWEHSQGGVIRILKLVWDKLQRGTHPDETLLSRLRKAQAIEIFHPESLSGQEVRVQWADFLDVSRRRHWPWFLINALIAPFTVLLAPFPGPNVIGYWIAYRAIHHGLILHGLRKARGGQVEATFKPAEALETPIIPSNTNDAARLEGMGCDPAAVDLFFQRSGVKHPG